MSLALQTLNNGDTNYVAKHNSNYSDIETAVNGILAALGATSGGSTANLLAALFGSQTAFLGNTSYTQSTAGTVMTVTAGYAWRPDLGTVLYKATSTGIDFAGQSAGTYYIVLGADGTPARQTTSTFALYSVVWSGSAFGTITTLAPILPNGDVQGTYQTLTLVAGAVSLAKMANLAANSLIGNNTGSPATPIALTISQVVAMLSAEVTTNKGVANGYASLDSGGKVPTSQLPGSVVGAVDYQGTWNANTNSPSITTGSASSANKGYYYKVATAGTTTVDGINDWGVGDWIISDGVSWGKIDNTEAVSSVAGRTGAIVLDAADIASGTFSTARIPALRYDLSTFFPGVPANSQLVLRWQAPRAITIPSGATNSQASAGTAATGSTTFTIKQNGSSVGTIVWSASGTTGAFTVSSTINIAAGDVITITGPATADATLADISITLAATA